MTMQVTLTWHGENRFVGRGQSGAPVLINFAPGETAAGVPAVAAQTVLNAGGVSVPGGTDRPPYGPSPTELLLIAAGGCTGLDVISLLQKKRVAFTGLELVVSGERAPDHPRYFTDVHILYRLKAAPDALVHLERSAQLSMDKYCSVGLSLRANKTWKCEVVSEDTERL